MVVLPAKFRKLFLALPKISCPYEGFVMIKKEKRRANNCLIMIVVIDAKLDKNSYFCGVWKDL